MEKPKLFFVVGPTASGKTAVSIEIALLMGAEIVSADSIQIYHGLDIGSAKPDETERRGVSHHMLDFVPPGKLDYSVARYREDALACMADIWARGKTPLVVGGTGLYINALVYPLAFNVPPNAELRLYWAEREAAQQGSAHEKLTELDPAAARRLHPNDVKRVIRAIEVHAGAGEAREANFTRRDDESLPYVPVMAGLNPPRELLYKRIEARVDAMLRAGLEGEVRSLLETGVSAASPAMQGLGYKQIAAFLYGACSREEAVHAIKQETRRYAKRQLTWFRREERIRWYDPAQYESPAAVAAAICDDFLEVNDG